MHELFNIDISKKNYMELADWLTDCRNVVIRENYDTEEEYISDVARFFEQWEYFYEQNEEMFKEYNLDDILDLNIFDDEQ